METAKLEMAGQINTQIAALIENSIANKQLNNEEAASVTKTVAASKNLIAQEMGQVIPMVEMYKKIGKNVEANVRLAYNMATAFDVAKKVIRKNLEEETKIAHEKLEQLMKFKTLSNLFQMITPEIGYLHALNPNIEYNYSDNQCYC